MNANPFEFEAAIRFTPDEMVDYFIDNHNFARFVSSQRNVFLLGDRGTGKTMILRYYSLPVQVCRAKRATPNLNNFDLTSLIGIYIPCRNTSFAKPEPDLFGPVMGRAMSEHFMIVAMINALAESLRAVPNLVTASEELLLRQNIGFVLQWDLPPGVPIFQALQCAAMRESIQSQQTLNRRVPNSYYENAVTFATALLPLVQLLTDGVEGLKSSHFSFMFDDAESLSDMQNATLNTWIASRDTSRISFKVATSLVEQKSLLTLSQGELLERHDFIRVEMEQDFQNTEASFHKLAQDIVERRLEKTDINRTAHEFFPINSEMEKDLEKAKEQAKLDAKQKMPQGTSKQIQDYVYKYSRAYYFRARSPRANRPPYSGFDLIVHTSTGVIRYLLEPCYEMYDEAKSRLKNPQEQIAEIPSAIQTERLEVLSKRRWEWIKQGFNNSVRGCTREDATKIANLLDNLATHFLHRLQNHNSEPRAITFTISAKDSFEKTEELLRLLEVARRAQILFRRTSSGKDDGKREDYYTFDRLLWIDRGLDPVGQNASVSLEARFLWSAAFQNQPLPISAKEKSVHASVSGDQQAMFEL